MADEYTPTTEDVRRTFTALAGHPGILTRHRRLHTEEEMEEEALEDQTWSDAFDRWLAEHDREVAAKALEDAARKMQDGIGEAYNPSRVDYAQQKHEAQARRAWLRSRAADVREGRFHD